MTAPDAELQDFLTVSRGTVAELEQRFGARAEEGGRVALMEESGPGEEKALSEARELQEALFDAGLAWPDGPTDLGGGGRGRESRRAVEAVLDEYALPSRALLLVGLHIVAPAVLAHGSAELKKRYLPGLFRGELVGCQLFSEPSSGSDLASARTSARRDGADWVVTGQKVWTSGAHLADVGELLVRSDPEASKHGGLSMFLVDMRAPGVTVRPLRQMTGGAAFNEVFLDEVRVPDDNRIGELGQGWQVANTSLSSEREAMMSGLGPLSQDLLDQLNALVARSDRHDEPVVRDLQARIAANVTASRAFMSRAPEVWGELARVSGSVSKLLLVETTQLIIRLVTIVAGSGLHLDRDETFQWAEFLLGEPSLHIAGGTDEIQRNVVAQRGLGLPR